ncbi:protein Gawky-like isoform X5 [Centruroides sculpturatus]|uniref:protein Gawky-like isoform X5 n=2 Tax=Centruroides sculpturatus TaxID=218467 RepID=UPI000C6DF23C|nr:protein Gawky-like isoform X5 [Centruroides sculpturatus]
MTKRQLLITDFYLEFRNVRRCQRTQQMALCHVVDQEVIQETKCVVGLEEGGKEFTVAVQTLQVPFQVPISKEMEGGPESYFDKEQEIADRHNQLTEGSETYSLDYPREGCVKEERGGGDSCDQISAQIASAPGGREEESMKQQTQSQQQAASKRSQAGNTQQSATQSSRYPPREVPPRFMQQQPVKNKSQKGRDGEFNIWGEPGNAWEKVSVDDHNKDSQSDMTLETSSGNVSTPNSLSGSVISSSSLCGVQGTTTCIIASTGGSLHNHSNAHHGVQSSNANSFEASHCSGSSMLGGCTLNQGNPQSSSNSQSAQSPSSTEWGTTNFEPMDSSIIWGGASTVGDRPQGSNIPQNQKQNPIGAKNTSDLSLQQATTCSNNPHGNSVNGQSSHQQDMQSGLHSADCMERYSDCVSGTASPLSGPANHSSNGRSFPGCNNNNSFGNGLGSGGHSNNLHQSQNQHLVGNSHAGESCSSHSQNISYGAQYNSSNNMPNSQVSGNDHSSSNIQNNPPYPGWQGLNSGANGSSYKGWNIPENSVSGRNAYVNHSSHTNANTPDSSKNGGSSHKTNSGSIINCNILSHSAESSSDNMYEGLIGATGGSNTPPLDSIARNNNGNYQRESTNSGWGMPPRMGLLGGGESSLNNGTSSWGGPPPAGTSSGWSNSSRQNSGPSTDLATTPNQGETSTGLSPPKCHGTWAQAAGKGLNQQVQSSHNDSCDNSNNESQNEQGSHIVINNGSNKVRTEEINEIKIAAAFSDGWGQMGINQDTTWDVPQSPQTSPKDTSNSMWRAPANTGTEIWESNIRHRSKTPASNTSNTHPWGHTPSTHIGGTWGEDEDNSNMWTGVPQSTNWNEETVRHNIWPGSTHHTENNNNNNQNNKNWGNQNTSSWEGNGPDNGTSVWASTATKTPNIGTWSPVTTPKKDIQPSGWEEPSPPTSRRPLPNYDDGTSLWGNPKSQGRVSHWKDMPAAKPIMNNNVNQGPMPSGSMLPSGAGNGPVMAPAGPGMIRIPPASTVNKADVGIAVWGKPPLNRGASWSDMPPHRDSPGINNWEDSHTPPLMKNIPGTPTTPGGAFSGGWNDQHAFWGAKPKGSTPNWGDGQIDTSTWSAKQGGKPLSKDLICASKQFRLLTEMGFKKDDVENALRNNNMNIDDALAELQTLSTRENNTLDLDSFGGSGRCKMRPNMPEEICLDHPLVDANFGPGNFHGSAGFQGQQILAPAFGGAQTLKPQVKQGSGLNSNTPSSLLSNAALGGQASSLNMGNSISSLSPALVQKILQQHQPPTFNPSMPQNAIGGQAGRVGQQNFPSAAQLRTMFQQIQMAVQAGHLNPQILNHPLAPQTLQLLFQLLQQIKTLHQLQQQQQFVQSQHMGKTGGGGPGNPLQLNVQITQTKQRIVNLQNQIAAQQAMFLKQQNIYFQQQQHHTPGHPSLHTPQPSSEIFKPNVDPMSGLHADFRDLSLKDSTPQPQSRLTQWKLPSFEKDDTPPTSNSGGGNNNVNNGPADFSRAPGSLSKSSGLSSSSSHAGSNLHPLLSQGESAWSTLPRNQNDMGGWPDSAISVPGNNTSGNNNNVGNNPGSVPTTITNCNMNNGSAVTCENKDSSAPQTPVAPSSTTTHPTYNLTDLVPEFEPGKPWKGTSQMKNVEDDPHITPGSVARSPLSVNTIKDTDLFNWTSKSSPVTASSTDSLVSSLATLTSSTWAFTPPTSASLHNSATAVPGKSGSSKPSWGPLMSDNASGSELWGSAISKTRGPPPGLAGQGKGMNTASWGGQTSRHGWNSNDNRSGLSSGWDRQASATFLVLRNLTPQIDGSTLKTLCMQHGPLQQFHLFLNHGIALVRYQTREESAKAQSALNNCVLGNTTILADIPSDSEVQQYMQLPGGQLAATNVMGWPATPQAGNSVNHGFRTGNNSYYSNSSNTAGGKIDSNAWNGSGLNIPGGNHLWSFNPPNSASLWASNTPMNDHEQNASTQLNSYLPGDLLNGEPM